MANPILNDKALKEASEAGYAAGAWGPPQGPPGYSTSIPGMGYLLGRPHWRKGYASEAIEPVLDYGFTQLGLDRVELWIHRDNQGSQQLGRRAGFSYKGAFPRKYPADDFVSETVVLGLRANEWLARHDQPAMYPTSTKVYELHPVLAVRDVDADVTPNILQVAPRSWELPPFPPPAEVKGAPAPPAPPNVAPGTAAPAK